MSVSRMQSHGALSLSAIASLPSPGPTIIVAPCRQGSSMRSTVRRRSFLARLDNGVNQLYRYLNGQLVDYYANGPLLRLLPAPQSAALRGTLALAAFCHVVPVLVHLAAGFSLVAQPNPCASS
jgi:hypothetical protein